MVADLPRADHARAEDQLVKAAIVGLGWWGRVMVESVDGPGATIAFTRGFVRNTAPVQPYAQARGLILAPSFEALLEDASVDAVVLATPHSAHVEQIVACAAAGKPVFCEKPLALSLADARTAVAACRSAGVPLALGTDRRVLPAVKRLKALVADGSLGELLHFEAQYSNDNMSRGVSGNWRMSADETPGGGMTGPGLHALDALLHLGGQAATVAGRLQQPYGADAPVDTVSLMGGLASGATFVLGCVRGVPNYFRLAAFGTAGWAEVRGFGEIHHQPAGAERVVDRFADDLNVGELLQDFGRTVRDGAPFPVSTTSMLQTVAAFEAALQSFGQPGAVTVEEVNVDV